MKISELKCGMWMTEILLLDNIKRGGGGGGKIPSKWETECDAHRSEALIDLANCRQVLGKLPSYEFVNAS